MLLSDDYYPVSEVARRATCSRHPIDVVPSHISLMSYEPELNASATGQIALSKKLQAASARYDVALLDTPPSLNLYARMALVACDHLIIPSDLKPFANQGLLNVLDLIKKTNEFRQFIARPAIDLLGVLPTKIATHAKFVQYSLPARRKAVEERYGVRLMDAQIFEREDLAKATEQTEFDGLKEVPAPLSIFDFKPDSTAAAEFEALAREVVQRAGLQRKEVLQ
jgi:cellulose biosynthesis protein BcsQ